MLIESIARRYSKALFGLAVTEKTVDTIGHELNDFVKILKKENRFREIWVSIQIAGREKKGLIQKSFPELSDLMMRFLFILIDKHREKLMEKALEEYQKLLLDFYNQAYVEVEAASDVSEEIQKQLKERLTQKLGKRIELLITVDPSLLGGMILRIGDRIVDGTLRTKLERIKENLLNAPLPLVS